MRSTVAVMLALLGCVACSGRIARGETAPSGRTMMRVSCPSGWEECMDIADQECGYRGIRSERSGDQDLTLWFQCLPNLRGNMRATTDPQGRNAWIDRCDTRADCIADAEGVCPEGYAVEYAGTAANPAEVEGGAPKEDSRATQMTMLFRCKADSE
jgi:hypothetical protein